MQTEPRIATWSYSRLKDFEKCPYKAYLKYALKRPEPEQMDRTALERGSRVHKAAEDYIQLGAELVDELVSIAPILRDLRELYLEAGPEVVQIEHDWGFTDSWEPCEWMADNVWGRMKLDALVIENNQADCYDWKTGKKFGNEVAHAQQSQQYALGTMMRFPGVEEVNTRFVYTDQKGAVTLRKYTRTQVMQFLPIIDRRAREMTDAITFPAKPNRINCKYCPYGPSKGDSSCEYGVDA